jgi:hypothetical protein
VIRDYKNANDLPAPGKLNGTKDKARGRVEQASQMLEQQQVRPRTPGAERIAAMVSDDAAGTRSGEQAWPEPLPVQYAPLDRETDARYDEETDAILINENYRDVTEPALLEPLLAHEMVHSRYRSDEPTDEVSLQEYVDEEMEAYEAQLNSWLQAKGSFDQKYPTPESRQVLGSGLDLLSSHLQLEASAKEGGWAGIRQGLEQKYRQRMLKQQAGG